ncbi:MAG: DUF3775 domain-containing protein [Alphaproteobacteria bacterium]
MQAISLDDVCYIVANAREFDAQEGVVELDYGANPSDEGFREILAAYADDATFEVLKTFIDGLNRDQQCELVGLAWLGRGDFERSEWAEALTLARDRHNDHTATYLLGMPLLADYLEEGLAAFGRACSD